MKILIIDGNNQMYRAHHSYARLQNHGKPVSIIYGMPVIVNGLINQFKPDMVFICWDGGRHKVRVKLNPNYKAGRKTKTDDEAKAFYHQRDEVMRLFLSLGIKQLYHKLMEADDYIYMLVKKFQKDKDNKITIASSDKDFHQLIRSNVKVYNTASRLLVHNKNLKQLYGYSPNNAVDYLVLTGDSSDNIKGYPGVGPAKAAGLLDKFSSIENFINSEEEFAKIDKIKLANIYSINKKLIDLKLFYRENIKGNIGLAYYNHIANPKFNMGDLLNICKEYSIKKFKETSFINNYKK